MKLRILRIIVLITIISTLVYFNGGLNIFGQNATAHAVGDLTVDWGVPEGSPIFTVTNFSPGQSQSRLVHVTNSATSPRPVGVRGNLTDQTNNLDTVLGLVVQDGGTDVYGGTSGTGPKTLAQFFSESSAMSGIALSTLNPGQTKNYTFTVTFLSGAGNDFQNSHVTFDLHIGIFFELPQVCTGIAFSGSPIFGTSGNDNLHGGNGNDLIISFEGNDTINSGNGNDCIIAGNGNNNLQGGNGKDIIVAGNGNNTIDGGNEADVISAGNGNNKIAGGNGSDTITVGNGTNTIDGGNDNDHITTGTGTNKIKGGNGNDVILSSPGSTIDGGNGTDTCVAGTKTHCEF